MLAHGGDRKHSTSSERLSREQELAFALDGARPTAYDRAVAAHEVAMHVERIGQDRSLARLRRWAPQAIAVVDSKLSSPRSLLQFLDIPHIEVDSLSDVPRLASIVVLGCQEAEAINPVALESTLSRGVTIISSDKTALAKPIRDVLLPGAPRPAGIARVEWATGTASGAPDLLVGAPLLPGIQLPPGYIPVTMPAGSRGNVEVLAIDRLTRQPILVRAKIGGGTVIHAVPHWWQQSVHCGTAVDRRRLADIPAFADLSDSVGDVRFGELQAARSMMMGLLRALRPRLR
ncbi:MAG TPA: hypothetical protein PLR44_07765 [Thermomicrobiales bacterium]|nr:hypothetical protein [Chloroflexota bacterium]HQZ89935.1 hypothetical protein [Thermomicrobiales bacterium]HRA31771.1 hypothetical protein [Thermomicrobiales bacterium]